MADVERQTSLSTDWKTATCRAVCSDGTTCSGVISTDVAAKGMNKYVLLFGDPVVRGLGKSLTPGSLQECGPVIVLLRTRNCNCTLVTRCVLALFTGSQARTVNPGFPLQGQTLLLSAYNPLNRIQQPVVSRSLRGVVLLGL